MGYTHYWKIDTPFDELRRFWNEIAEVDLRPGLDSYIDKKPHYDLVTKKWGNPNKIAVRLSKRVIAFKNIVRDLKVILNNLPEDPNQRNVWDPPYTDSFCYINGIELAGGDGTGKPIITDTQICINGVGPQSHETFSLDALYVQPAYYAKDIDAKELMFHFCKTARKPYDYVVCMALIIAEHWLGKDIEVSSDGDYEDWKPIIESYIEILKRPIPKTTFKRFQEEIEHESSLEKA